MKISVIGTGPVGSYAALKLTENNHSVTVYEQKKEQTVKHSGLFSNNLNDLYKPPKKVILNKIKGAKIIAPNGDTVHIGGKKTRAIVTDTLEFDKSILNKALDNGAKIKWNTKVNDIETRKNRVFLNKKYKYQYLIDASGPKSVARTNFGLDKMNTYQGVETIAKYPNYPEDYVELFLGDNVAPNFFAWTIPLGDGRAKIGLITKNNAKDYFKKFIKKLGVNKYEKPSGGIIPIGYYKDFIINDRVSLVGDAAGHTKSTTGGGAITGFNSVNLLIKQLNKKQPDFKQYYKEWKKGVGKELYYHYRIRKFYNKLNDNDLNELVPKIKNYTDFLQEYGDMDYPTRFVPKLLKKPGFLKLGLKHFFKIF